MILKPKKKCINIIQIGRIPKFFIWILVAICLLLHSFINLFKTINLLINPHFSKWFIDFFLLFNNYSNITQSYPYFGLIIRFLSVSIGLEKKSLLLLIICHKFRTWVISIWRLRFLDVLTESITNTRVTNG